MASVRRRLEADGLSFRRGLGRDLPEDDAAARFLRASEEERERMRAEAAREEERKRAIARDMPKPLARATRPWKIDPSTRAKIRAMAKVMSEREIARRLNVTRATISRAIHQEPKKAGRPRADGKTEKKTMAEKREHSRKYEKRKRMKKNVDAFWQWSEEHKRKAQIVLVGRDLDPNGLPVFLNPTTDDEREARADFVFWLRHVRRIGRLVIVKMLHIPLAEVDAIIASRVAPDPAKLTTPGYLDDFDDE